MQRSVLVLALWFAAPAAAYVHPEHFRGALLGSLGDNLDRMSREDLDGVLTQLRSDAPTFAAPITLLSIGTAVGGAGGALVWATLDLFGSIGHGGSATSNVGNFLLGIVAGVFSAVVLIVAAVLLTIGIVFLIRDLVENADNLQRQANVKDRLEQLDREAAPIPLPPPPPPPPPPPLGGLAPGLSFVVARF